MTPSPEAREGSYGELHSVSGSPLSDLGATFPLGNDVGRTPATEYVETMSYAEGQTYNHKLASPIMINSESIGNDRGLLAGKEGMLLDTGDLDRIEEHTISNVRKWWCRLVWAFTWWIPSKALSSLGRMKRRDVQMAWREKVTICAMIFLVCATILFYILAFGRVICPDKSKAWNDAQLLGHQEATDYYVAVRGKVYDLTKFWHLQHSDTTSQATNDVMLSLAGQDLTSYFPVPLTIGCPMLVTDTQMALQTNSSSYYYTPLVSQAIHTSGPLGDPTSKLYDVRWYPDRFLPFMKKYYKGYYVVSSKNLLKQSSDRQWAIIDGKIYDLGNYLWTLSLLTNDDSYKFLPDTVSNLFGQTPGQDISEDYHLALSALNSTMQAAVQNCMDNVFYAGLVDFRESPRCTVQDYLLLSFSMLLVAVMLIKFLAALQLAPKRHPEQQNKFVICQVPCYTEGEEELRKTIDSLAALQYDDKRKLLFIICDGNITGNGNDLPTPRIVLDILGVDPKLDPEPKMFKSVAEGSKQLNYGQVYSGLYEFEGHVVPYLVVVKVGRPSERKKPGNRGKRDTQILLMRYLNRVHFDGLMYPLELEICHNMKNVIGIDPAFYEYILMVDADTTVAPDGLNRLVAVAADDSSVIAVCGETKLFNEESSWWTMIQVYEYFISHHMAKAFESLFGSVTCLPGCFSMYRIRSADKGRPLFISDRIIDEYSENRVDTLHKKNLLSLGEDRYLTTLILKHFHNFSTKFTSDAQAQTTAPERWDVLLSQRRRWINSTIHNLAELMLMKEMCGFCFFSMRFIVFIDLLGTIILPATTVYLVYLIIDVAAEKAAIPYISLAMLIGVYGLQAVIFLLKRQWQYIGWLVIYLLAYPIWSFFLPIYSFWHMDDFSWGNTRIVVGEKGNKKIVAGTDDEPYDDSMIPLMRFSEYERNVLGKGEDALSVLSGPEANSSRHGPFAGGSFDSHSRIGSRAPSENGNLSTPDAQRNRRRASNITVQSGMMSNDMLSHSHSMPVMMPTGFGQGPAAGFMAHTQSIYGMPRAPMPSMYGMPAMMMATPSHPMSMYGTPNHGSMWGFPQPAMMMSMPTGVSLSNPYPAVHTTGGSEGWPSGSSNPLNRFNHSSSGRQSLLNSPTNLTPSGSAVGSEADLALAVLPVSERTAPTDGELFESIRAFLAMQTSLMSVSKRDVRKAIMMAYPNAPLIALSKPRINRLVDEVIASIA
jgi:chitin synthase